MTVATNNSGTFSAKNSRSTSSFEPLEGRTMFAAGSIDSLFGTNGTVVRNIFNGDDYGFAVAVQSDGKVLVAGRASNGVAGGSDFAVARFNSNGSVDTTFGVNGIATTDLGSLSDSAYAMAIQSDGKIVLAGETTRSTTDFALVRYNANGTLDMTFGNGGKVVSDLSGDTDQPAAMTLDPSGKIVVTGWMSVSGLPQFAAARYNSNGSLDMTFGSGGVATAVFSAGYSLSTSVVALADGSVVVAGTSVDFTTGSTNATAIKLSNSGIQDSSFGTGGWALLNFGGDSDSAAAIAKQSDGKLVIGGSYYDSNTGVADFGLARITATGQLDTTFGSNGVTHTDFGADWDQVNAVVVSGSRIIAAGIATVAGKSVFALAQYTSAGVLDSTFGTGGRATVGIGNEAVANAVAVDSQCRIVLGGFALNGSGNYDLAAARFIGRVDVAPTANAGGSYTVATGGSVQLSGAASSDPDGTIVAYEWDLNYDGSTFDVDATGATTTFSAASLVGPLTRTIALRVIDNDGVASVIVTSTVTVSPPPNVAPTANAGGPYSVASGDSTQLDGSHSSDSDGQVVTYQWDFNYDGSTFDVDATGAKPTFSAAGMVGPFTRTIALRVIDNNGATSTVVITTMTVNAPPNVVPVANAGGPYSVASGGSVQLDGTHSSDSDGHVVTYEWDFNYDGHSFDVDATGATPTFSAAGMVGPINRTIALRVTDNSAASSVIVTSSLTVNPPPNVAPTANAGGSYTVDSNGTVQLDGSGSSDSDGSIVSYEWDFNYNGSSFDVDATGAKPTFSAAGLTGPLSRTVALRVTDNSGASSVIVTATVTVNPPPNVAPVANAGGPYTVDTGASVLLDGTGSSDSDGQVVKYEWDFNYNGSSFDVDATGASPMFTTTGLTGPLVRTIALRVTDNSGATSVVTTTVTVNAPTPPPNPDPKPGTAVLQDDPDVAGKKILIIYGTPSNDIIRLMTTGGQIDARINDMKLGKFANISRIIAYGGGGNDIIDAHRVTVPVELFGQAGNDMLMGSAMNDILVGGDGNDELLGGHGDDLIVGGKGEDNLHSRFGNDMMIGGSLTFETNHGQLLSLLKGWNNNGSSSALSKKVAKLLDPASVIDDHVKDKLHGTPDSDMIVAGAEDKIDKLPNEKDHKDKK